MEQFAVDMIHNDLATLRAELLNYTGSGKTARPHLKVRQLPVADREGIDRGLQEADLGRIASELGSLPPH